jgi:hypothetical protein
VRTREISDLWHGYGEGCLRREHSWAGCLQFALEWRGMAAGEPRTGTLRFADGQQ